VQSGAGRLTKFCIAQRDGVAHYRRGGWRGWLSAGMSFHFRIWPMVALVVGLLLTLAWTAFLGYGLFELVEFAI
jgi:hypothetical protein